jgi:endonuclease YncB( thermonuclease family)
MDAMKTTWNKAVSLALLTCWLGILPAHAGDSLYGKVTEVKRADLVTLDYGTGQYDLTLVGIDVPRDGPIAAQAIQFVSQLVLDKNARMRFQGRSEGGEMQVRLFTDDPSIGIKDVSVELVRAGLARRKQGFDFPYGELAKAEKEARAARRGLWATSATTVQ